MSGLIRNKKDILNKIVKIIVKTVQPKKIILFGSQAKGNNHPDSDYDILIIKDNIENEREISRSIYKALYDNRISVAVDIIAIDSNRWDKNKSNKYLIYSQVDKEGAVLYE